MTQEQLGVYRLKQYPGVPLSFLPDQFARRIIDNLNSPYIPKICTAWADRFEYVAPVPARDPRVFPQLNDEMRSLKDPPLCYFDGESHLVRLPFPTIIPVGVMSSHALSHAHTFSTFVPQNVKEGLFRRETTISNEGKITSSEPCPLPQSACDWNVDHASDINYHFFVLAPHDTSQPFTLVTNPLLSFEFKRFLTQEDCLSQRQIVSVHMRDLFPDDPRCNQLDQLLSTVWDPDIRPGFSSQTLQ